MNFEFVGNRSHFYAILKVMPNRRRSAMDEPASRRRFLRDITALGAAGSVSAAFAADNTHADEPRQVAQAQPGATRPGPSNTTMAGGLPRIHLMSGPGTLPSVGKV